MPLVYNQVHTLFPVCHCCHERKALTCIQIFTFNYRNGIEGLGFFQLWLISHLVGCNPLYWVGISPFPFSKLELSGCNWRLSLVLSGWASRSIWKVTSSLLLCSWKWLQAAFRSLQKKLSHGAVCCRTNGLQHSLPQNRWVEAGGGDPWSNRKEFEKATKKPQIQRSYSVSAHSYIRVWTRFISWSFHDPHCDAAVWEFLR